jgi:hypothetical protein
MSPAQGLETDQFGQWLASWVKRNLSRLGYQVFYDHGDRRLANVAAVKGFHGETVTSLNRLADVDVMVVDSKGAVVLLVEIEERASSPKKVLGDAITILMCSRFAVGRGTAQQYFEVTRDTRLVISGVMPDNGKRVRKIEEIIEPRFHEASGFKGGILPRQVEFVFAATMDEVLKKLRAIVLVTLPIQ